MSGGGCQVRVIIYFYHLLSVLCLSLIFGFEVRYLVLPEQIDVHKELAQQKLTYGSKRAREQTKKVFRSSSNFSNKLS